LLASEIAAYLPRRDAEGQLWHSVAGREFKRATDPFQRSQWPSPGMEEPNKRAHPTPEQCKTNAEPCAARVTLYVRQKTRPQPEAAMRDSVSRRYFPGCAYATSGMRECPVVGPSSVLTHQAFPPKNPAKGRAVSYVSYKQESEGAAPLARGSPLARARDL
jgi:hypothetical protein